ncbi:CASP-like protein [Tripterygium wilfordii]|uniref:CASP-like protein n=1 Tax=Tripterygium wilfordii TaxID=458696 RepID=A0A7J7C867_TRIWF|nr:CASP-like protein 4A4 [Tripterygium wilfordii]KAF5729956.1 CASP-like protein [Tripterygium wilfordii]
MKQERDMLVIQCPPTTSVSPATRNLMAQQQQLPTPSPFSLSAVSTTWSSRPSIHFSSLFLRFLALVFSFVSATSMGAPPLKKKSQQPSSFTQFSELMYCFIVSILAFIYSAFQLFKGVCDIAHRGIFISDMISDYMSFILDQLIGYLLISSSSVAILAVRQIEQSSSLWKAAIISDIMSFSTFLVIATSAILSGYRLCKRVIW